MATMIDDNDQRLVTEAGSDDVDELFLERLQAFLDKSLGDLKAFALRENRPFDQTRRYVADWHARYLFSPQIAINADKHEYIHSALAETSRVLESLHTFSGIHSFFLAIDPANPGDQGFLGGTILGREFWRGLRGGGEAGANNFRSFCLNRSVPPVRGFGQTVEGSSDVKSPTTIKRGPASSVKAEVYANVRDALRAASNSRTAEMKWTNHTRLESAYGVRLVGWPPSVPMRNPSALTMGQNQTVLEALRGASMRFERVSPGDSATAERLNDETRSSAESNKVVSAQVESRGRGGKKSHVRVTDTGVNANIAVSEYGTGQADEDISWAYEYCGPSTSNPISSTLTDPRPPYLRQRNLDSIIPVNEEAGPLTTQSRFKHQNLALPHDIQHSDIHPNLTELFTMEGYYDDDEQSHGTSNDTGPGSRNIFEFEQRHEFDDTDGDGRAAKKRRMDEDGGGGSGGDEENECI